MDLSRNSLTLVDNVSSFKSHVRQNVRSQSSEIDDGASSPFQLFRRPPRYHSLTKSTIFQPNPENPQPLIKDLVQRINYWRSNPGKQHKQELIRHLKKGKLLNRDGTPLPRKLKSPKETFDLLADVYFEHAKNAAKLPPSPRTPMPDILPISPGQRTPRFMQSKRPPPPTTSDVIAYVNDIFYTLRILPSIELSQQPEIGRYIQPLLPGKSPYPNLCNSGLIQPRPGAPLRRLPCRTPLNLSSVTSVRQFEEYIYSIAFHRNVSIKLGRELITAFVDPRYQQYLSLTAFRYAITSLLQRASDLYSARRLGEVMAHRGIPLDIYIYNQFLMGALRVENLRMFAMVLREILQQDDVQADSTTWNIALRMGIKIKSRNWVHSVLEVMKSRGIALDHDALKATFMALEGVVSSDVLKQYYLDYYSKYDFVLWKPFHVVLNAVGKEKGIDEAWNLLIEVSRKGFPVEATLSLFLQLCQYHNDYERAWKMIGDFKCRWGTRPVQRGISRMFQWACKLEEFSDAILLWKWAKLRHVKWVIHRDMFLAARKLEREYGVAVLTAEIQPEGINRRWFHATTKSRNKDPLNLIPASQRQYVELMCARKHSESRQNDPRPLSEKERLWAGIRKTYNEAVMSGVWKPKPAPRIPPGQQPKSSKSYKTIKPLSRLESRENFRMKEMLKVWEMVKSGELKIPQSTDSKKDNGIPQAS